MKKKLKKLFSFKRWMTYPFFILIVALLLCDIYFETEGVPDIIKKRIHEKILAKGIDIKIEKITAGIFSGITLKDVTVFERKKVKRIFFSAKIVKCDTSLHLNGLKFEGFSVRDGKISMLMFPETEEEGLFDTLDFDNIEAEILKNGNGLEIKYATASMSGFLLNISGQIKNTFTKDQFVLSATQYSVPSNNSSFSSVSMAIPFNTRALFSRELALLKRQNMKVMPSLQVNLNIDSQNLLSNVISCKLRIPAFTFRDVPIKEITGSFDLEGKSITLDSLRITDGKNDSIDAKGELDLSTLIAKFSAKSSANPYKYLTLISPELLKKHDITPLEKNCSAEINVSSFSLLSFASKGRIDVNVPELKVKNMLFEDIASSLLFTYSPEQDPDELTVERFRLSCEKDEFFEFSGTINKKTRTVRGEASGKLIPAKLMGLLPEEKRKSISEGIKIGDTQASFKGFINELSLSPFGMICAFDFKLPDLQVKTVCFKGFSGNISMDKDGMIKGSNIETVTGKGNRIKANLLFSYIRKELYLNINSSGDPSFVYELPEGDEKEFMKRLYDSFVWPAKSEDFEINARVHSVFGEKPETTMVGNIVVSNFQYNKIPFDYGACDFFVFPENLIVLPRIILQHAKNRALLSIVYDNRKALHVSILSKILNSPSEDTDKLYFEVDSDLPGNSILKTIIPDWKNECLDFSDPTPVKVSGAIDYVNNDKTYCKAKITDAPGKWNGLPVTGIDAELTYINNRLEIKDLYAEAYKGSLNLSYLFDFKNNKGDISILLKDSEFTPLVTAMGMEEISGKKVGTISGSMKADMTYNAEDDLLMKGNGKINIKDADIWSVPMLHELSVILGKKLLNKEWVEIDSIDCDYILDGSTFKTDSIQTNGNAIALTASGTYDWNSSVTDFKVRAKVLKNLLPFELIAKLMDPVAWALEVRLYGKGKDLKWEQVSGLKNLFK